MEAVLEDTLESDVRHVARLPSGGCVNECRRHEGRAPRVVGAGGGVPLPLRRGLRREPCPSPTAPSPENS